MTNLFCWRASALALPLAFGQMIFTQGAFAQDSSAPSLDLDQLQGVLGTSASPFLLPMEFDAIAVQSGADGSGETLTLSHVSYAGVQIETVTFDVQPLDEDRIRITNFNFPASTRLGPEDDPVFISWQPPKVAIVYNLSQSAPEGFTAHVNDVTLTTPDERATGFLSSLNLSIEFDGTTLHTNFQSGKGSFVFEDAWETVTLPIPDSELTYMASGYEAGGNPLATTGPQIEWMMGNLFADDMFMDGMETATLPYLIPDQFDLQGRIWPVEFVSPRGDFGLSYSEIMMTGQGRDLQDPEGSTMGFLAAVEGIRIRDGAGAESRKIDRLSYDMRMDGWDWTALAALDEHPAYQRLTDNFSQLADMGALGNELDMYQGLAVSDLIQVYAHMFAGMGRVEYDISMQGLSQTIPGVPGAVNMKSADMGFALDLRDLASGGAEFGIGFAGIDVPGSILPPDLAEFIPSKGSLNLGLSGLNLETLHAAFSDWERQGGTLETLDQDAEALFQTWFEGLDLQITPKLLLATPPTTLSADGAFAVDLNAAYAVTGSLLAKLSNFAGLQARMSDLANTASADMQQIFQGAVLGLGMLGGFGDLGDDGVLSLDIQLDDRGSVSVNGLPLPF